MKLAIWIAFAVLAGMWTAGALVAAERTGWVAGLNASGAVHDLGQAASRWPVPGWMAAWIDPSGLQSMLAGVQWTLGVLQDSFPYVGSALGWLVPLVWLVWGGGAVVLLSIAGLAHWLSARASRVGLGGLRA